MKTCSFLTLLILFTSCKTSTMLGSALETEFIPEIQNNEGYCPEDGNCSIKIHKNSSIILKKDTADNYYPVIEEGENIVVVFEFLIKGPEGTVDGDYSETTHFEINQTTENLNVEGKNFEQVKLLFGKHCFCRGEAGYRKITEGNLMFQKAKGEIAIDLTFKLNEVSHKIIRIKETIKL